MYLARLKIIKSETLEDVCIFVFGIFARPSTAERLRKEMAKNNPELIFVLQYEQVENIPLPMD